MTADKENSDEPKDVLTDDLAAEFGTGDEAPPRRPWGPAICAVVASIFSLAAAAHAAVIGAVFLPPAQIGSYIALPMVVSIVIWLGARAVERRFREEADIDVRAATLGASLMSAIATAMLFVLFAFWAVIHFSIVR